MNDLKGTSTEKPSDCSYCVIIALNSLAVKFPSKLRILSVMACFISNSLINIPGGGRVRTTYIWDVRAIFLGLKSSL